MFDDCGSRLESGSGEIVEALRVLIRTNDGAGSDINSHRQAAVQIAVLCVYGDVVLMYQLHATYLAIASRSLSAAAAPPVPRGRSHPHRHCATLPRFAVPGIDS